HGGTQVLAAPPPVAFLRSGELPGWQEALRVRSEIDSELPRLRGYEVLERLGKGGMAVVYKARQQGLDRIVALKMILGGSRASDDELARFRNEAEAVARLHHSNLVQIYEIGCQDNHLFLSLEYVDGGNLKEYLGDKPQPPRQAAELVETLARAIHYAHE